jgi:hypothetical protein
MGDRITVGDVSGNGNKIGNIRKTYNTGVDPAESARPGGEPEGSSSRHALYGFADIVGYSQLSVRLQKSSQGYLLGLLNDGLSESGVAPERVVPQNQGDARLLWFPPGTDAARVLAVMPRYLNDDLLIHNQDMAPHARLRVRLSFTMGAAVEAALGLAGAAPIAVTRLGNSAVFRRAMGSAPQAQCGVIVDSHLHDEYVRQRFRSDINPADFAPVHVVDHEKRFEATAWIRLFGYSSQQVTAMVT